MAILELLLLIVKIIILSTIYATVLFLIVFVLSKTKKITWAKGVIKLRFWLLAHLLISAFLLALSFTYWQDTGLGDNSKIPVGYGQTIQSEDFAWTYFYPDPDKTEPNKDELIIGNYKLADHFLCAEVSHQNTNSPSYDFIVYDLTSKSLKTFDSEQEYSTYAATHSLPQKTEFYDFQKLYREYLNNRPKWKQWLLP
jgi:heme/copper-type cytochrome/quinol oxidase subunit 2